jgi:GxxExxY protein
MRDKSGMEAGLNIPGEQGPFRGAEDGLTGVIIEVIYAVHRELGFGFLESVYAKAMAVALEERGLDVQCELLIPVWFHGKSVGIFRADVVVENKVILEFKVADQIAKAHEAQLLHYLRASKFEVGLLLNFSQLPRCRRLEFSNSFKGRSLS